MEQFESVKTMIDNLRSQNADQRLNSMRGIHLIATTLGPSRTRDELLLYLTDYLDDNDEVLKVFASALGTMLPQVGGLAYLSCLLNALEMLCSLDEITVREEAVLALQNLSDVVFCKQSNDQRPKDDTKDDAKNGSTKANYITACNSSNNNVNSEIRAKAQAQFVALVQRLGTGSPQCRSSACGLIATIYTHASSSSSSSVNVNNNNIKTTMLQLFLQLCKDKQIMVRRAACIAIATNFARILGAKGATELLAALNTFAKDGSDGVRLQTVATAIALLQVLPQVQHGPILAAMKGLSSDSSWRVRYMVADKLGAFANAVSPADVNSAVVPIFRALCTDAQPQIRAAAVYHMDNLLRTCSDGNAKKNILVTGTRLLSDVNSYVRMSLAGAVLKSVKYVAKQLWSTNIVPTCTTLLNDEDVDVRLALVSGFSSMNNSLEAHELAPTLVPVIINLAADPKWRLRDVVVSQIPHIITALGDHADQQVLQVCLERMVDRVATIRDAAVQSCCKLVASNGAQWASTVLLPRLNELSKDENYLHRVTLCHFYASLAAVDAFDSHLCKSSVWPVVQQLASDPIVNVRMNVAKVIKALQQNKKAPVKQAESLLRKLRQDANEDVRDAAAPSTITSSEKTNS